MVESTDELLFGDLLVDVLGLEEVKLGRVVLGEALVAEVKERLD